MKYMVADNEFINGKRTRFVMDRGFYSKENLQFLTGVDTGLSSPFRTA